MSRIVASPLGDLPAPRLAPEHWGAAMALALLAHGLGAAAYWGLRGPPQALESEDVMIGVQLGPPGGRLEPEPPPPAPDQPAPQPSAPAALTERAADAPPVTFTPPAPPPPPGAALSSGVGAGGAGTAPLPPPPPPPPEDPPFDRARLRAYANEAAQLIYEQIEYPYRSRERESEGRATIRLVIDRQGGLIASSLVSGTGDALLDQAIVTAVADVRRFPRIPRDYPGDQLRIAVSITFMMFRE